MTTTVKLSELEEEELKKLIGKRIILGGKGILDGLKHLSKSQSEKVIAIGEYPPYGKCIKAKHYGCKNSVLLPEWNWDQECMIFDHKEFKALPKWS